MVRIMELLENLKASRYAKRLKKIQEEASLHPENLFYQVRLADLLAKLKNKKEAVTVYERAAQQYIQKNCFAHAIALKKIILRLEPPKDEGEHIITLGRLYEQMLVYREKTSNAEEPAPSPTLPTATPSSPLPEKKGGGLQLEPKLISPSAL